MCVMCGSVSGGASCFAGEAVVVCEYMFCVCQCLYESIFVLCCICLYVSLAFFVFY